METEQAHQEAPLIPTPAPPSAPLPEKRMGKWRASYLLATEGLELLKKDKQVLLFPALSGLVSLAVIFTFCILTLLLLGFVHGEESMIDDTRIVYAAILLLYLALAFVATFFQSGLTAVIHARINGRNISFNEGVKIAWAHAEKIFLWSVIEATVGVILSFISNRSKWLGKLVSFFFNAAWGIITFFIVPSIILEQGSVPQAVKNSINTFKKTWGETLIVNFSIGLFFIAAAFLGLAVFALTATGVFVFLPRAIAIPLFFFFLTLFVIFLVAICVVSSAINSIFRVVLYEYAKSGHISDTFAPELILGTIKKSN